MLITNDDSRVYMDQVISFGIALSFTGVEANSLSVDEDHFVDDLPQLVQSVLHETESPVDFAGVNLVDRLSHDRGPVSIVVPMAVLYLWMLSDFKRVYVVEDFYF